MIIGDYSIVSSIMESNSNSMTNDYDYYDYRLMIILTTRSYN